MWDLEGVMFLKLPYNYIILYRYRPWVAELFSQKVTSD